MDLSDAVIVKSGRLKSVVWNDFDRVRKGDTYLAICRHCQKRLSGSSASGTSHLRNHLIRCRKITNHGIAEYFLGSGKRKVEKYALANIDHDHDEQRKDDVLSVVNVRYEHEQSRDDFTAVASVSLDQRRSRFDLARMIILHGYPLTMVEDVGFRVFVQNLQPLFELVAFEGVESDCMEIYAKEKHKIFESLDKLPGKISVSVDVWNSLEDAEYLCLTAHYIDETWGLKQRVLNFFVTDPSHTGEMHAEVIMTCLMEWDIDRKLFSMTSSHSPPFSEEVANKIRDRLSQNKFLYCNGQLFDVSCAVNVLSQMAQDSLQTSSEMIIKIREMIRHVRSSESFQEKFIRLAVEAGVGNGRKLCLDSPTQWDTTCTMLEIALEYKNVFCLMKEQERDPRYMAYPSVSDWERLGIFVGFLKLFVEVTNVFTKSKCQPANKYFPEICDIHLRLIELSKNPDDFISSMAVNMRKKFDEFWEKSNLALAIASILDPRFKMKLIEYYYPLLYGASASELIDDISECIKALYNEHTVGSLLVSSEQAFDWQQQQQQQSNGVNGKGFSDRLTEFDRYINDTEPCQDTKSDLEKYLEEPLFPRNSDFDILNWWRVHTPRYPILSMMARNVLAVPMSTVPAGHAFGTRLRQVDQNWSSLRPSTVQALMCAQDWIRSELESR
ncbi:PREDICTED: zinc finger BED domain-containing protein RICESLEEPER 1-like [Tarenaya hassleriana]|uniref:zinc finger BED domain-containing protein RICESLEEPER 1-like n=1 Tax=Tarenaya hassleriana TaxID=28532 RepID=UPI00053C8BBF|nr:PREDICTED: zinc finger BED domain-containing protein RICESLEEPER 1-like [Tarenaya hassleriana]XP_010551476.1 PREDICTED: zinc finger BED domain-containing protein RICESLEEPER 1-like [Tarenaya hassleriana]XP_010551477.1 PREDICTED: zinc finger BED domain-containing protein RICESLEEPER 1-like [Tarenaya hassleriana]